jgi:hypothetical protein
MEHNKYTPTYDEKVCAYFVAEIRNSKNGGGSNLPYGETMTHRERFEQHYVACLSEIAVSRLTNLCWTGCGKGATGLKDVGDRWEVRSITDMHKGLLVKWKDIDSDSQVLVFVDTKTAMCTVLGWASVLRVKEEGKPFASETDKPFWVLPIGMLDDWRKIK